MPLNKKKSMKHPVLHVTGLNPSRRMIMCQKYAIILTATMYITYV